MADRIHPTNPAAVWAERPDGNGFHWTVNPPADAAPAAQEGEAKPARKGKAKAGSRHPANTMVRFTNINRGEKFAVILASGTATVRYAPAV